MCAIERAVQIALLRPLHVISDHKIEFAVTIVVHPSGGRRKFIRPPQPCDPCNVGERAVAVVVKEMTLTKRADENIVVAVVVVVAYGHAHAVDLHREARFARDVGECAVVVIVIEL